MISRVLKCELLLHVCMDAAKTLGVYVFYTMSPVLSSEKFQ